MKLKHIIRGGLAMYLLIIYFYFFVCMLILLYTIGYILFQKYNDKNEKRLVKRYKSKILQQIELLELHSYIERDLYKMLSSKLSKTSNLLAFDKALHELELEQVFISDYLSQLESVVSKLVDEYKRKNQMEQAFLAWFIAKHGWGDPHIYQTLLSYKIDGENIYLRENVLTAIY